MFRHNMAVHKAMLCAHFYSKFGYDLRVPLWPDGDIFPNGDVLDDRVNPQIHLWRTGEVICTTAAVDGDQLLC
jgi:hypothetical protein